MTPEDFLPKWETEQEADEWLTERNNWLIEIEEHVHPPKKA
jgi:hypothetical protein